MDAITEKKTTICSSFFRKFILTKKRVSAAYKYDADVQIGLYFSDQDMRIPNPDPDHTSVLLELFLKHAKENIRIYCNQLAGEVYDSPSVIKMLKKVKDKINIQIITERNISGVNREFLKYIPLSNIRFLDRKKNYGDHFWVMDSRAYRQEKDSEKRIAWVHTNDPDGAKERIIKFDQMFSQAKGPSLDYSYNPRHSYCQNYLNRSVSYLGDF